MTNFVVAYMNFFDNNLVLEHVEADTRTEAIWKHSSLQGEHWEACKHRTDGMSDDEVGEFFFDCDTMVGAIAITPSRGV